MAPVDLDALGAEERRELLKRLLARDASALRTYPASFAQERLWLLSELEPGAAYHVYGAFALDEPLDPSALGRALDVIVARHDVLRTSFALLGGALAQVVADRVPSPLRLEDLSSLAPDAAEREAERLVQVSVDEPFAKNRAPLARVVLVRLPAGRQVLVLTLHHCIADLPSRELLVRELLEVYRAVLAGREARLPALPMQYAEHSLAERRAAERGGHAVLEAYWRERLTGLERGDLPWQLLRHGGERRAARHRLALEAEVTGRVRELGRRLGVTSFMTLLAGWAALQARLGGGADVCVGTPVTTRDRDELAGLIGPLIDTLPLRLRVDGARSFEELLTDTRTAVLADFEHRGLPFDRLVESLRLPRDPSRPPLFDVFFVLEDYRSVERSTRGVAGREWPVARAVPAFPLTVEWTDADDGLACVLEYDASRVDPGTVAALAARYVRLLAVACAQPSTPVRRLPVTTEAERSLQVSGWNQTALALPPEPTVFELFRAQVGRAPDRVAARCGDEAQSYSELERWTRDVAAQLTRAGCARGDVVGVCCQRGLASLAALLGVMRTGAAYLPIDPRQPAARIAMILRQAGARVCLVTEQSDGAHWDWGGRRVPVARRGDEPVADQAGAGPVADGDDLAYVIYTSGSGGTPKGVEVRHRGVVSCLVSLREVLGLRGDERFFAHTTPSFDIAAVELFLPLLVGGEVVIARPEVEGVALAQEVMASGATVVQATPSGWRSLLDGGWRGGGVTTVLCGGEPLGLELARRLLAEGASVWNLYGPTETTIWSTAHRLSPAETTVPVGRPLGNTVVYVLDAEGELVPAGSPGEVCIGGEGVARGYLGDPELTLRRFVPDPFRAGERLYRTGDLGRQRADGVLELAGRLDDQVKLRGHRVELGEVESCLAAHPALKAVAVVVERAGEPRLLACYTSAALVSEAELRAFVRARLPEVMVPAVFARCDVLPVTASGKVDRRALARLGAKAAPAPDVAPPATPSEIAVAAAFEQVLERRGVGRHDNFFDLGGHSLLVPAVVARLLGRAGRAPTPMDLFRYPTVAALASALDGGEGPAEAPASIAARARHRREAADAAARRGKEGRRGRR